MSDKDKPLDDLGEIDWDSALDDWEKNVFSAEIGPAADPSVRPASRDAAAGIAAAPDAQKATPVPPAPPRDAASGEAGSGASAAPPPQTRMPSSPSFAPPSRGVQRGGLGQLFARRDSAAPPPPAPSATQGEPHTSVTRQMAALATLDVPITEDSPTAIRLEEQRLAAASPAPAGDEVSPHGEQAATEGERAGRAASEPRIRPEPESIETLVVARSGVDPLADAETATRHPADEPSAARRPAREPSAAPPDTDDEPTRTHPSASLPFALAAALGEAPQAEREAPGAVTGGAAPEGERRASRWLDDAATRAFAQRATWLEDEAVALGDPADKARALIAVSELRALIGDDERALALASQARELAPDLALGWRQARQLMGPGNAALVAALDGEAAASPTPAARAHATLLAADVLRTSRHGDAAVERWASAAKLEPADVRAPTASAALALARDDHTGAGTYLTENSELRPLGEAVVTALRLRGAPRAGAEAYPTPVNDAFRAARRALDGKDVLGATRAILDIAAEPSLASAARWLSSAFGATHIAGRRSAAKSLEALAASGDALARRQLAARGLELGDPELVLAALADGQAFELAERASLLALAGQDFAAAVDALAGNPTFAPLVDALSAVTSAEGEDAVARRAIRVAGQPGARALGSLGRVVASQPATDALDEALAAVASPRPASAAGVALEAAVRGKRWGELSEALSKLPASDDAHEAVQRHIAAALVAEHARDEASARRAWREALASRGSDALLRINARVDAELDVAAELLRIADEMPDAAPSAILRLEALARADRDEDDKVRILERVHRAAPHLGVGAFLAERVARRRGDLDEVLRWLHERRAHATDPIETALDAVREALLVADRDPELASARLEEAHRARPDDFALRELYERLATEIPSDRAAWREARAAKATGTTRALLYTEAALEHERAGDATSALAAAREALAAGEHGVARLVGDRMELETGETTRQAGALLTRAKEALEVEVRREAYERLADIERFGRKNADAALEWHATLIDESPRHAPSLRFVEHELISRGLDEDLERIAERIALALDGTGGGEVAGHAQLAARLKQRVDGSSERTANVARLAATQPEPSLWSLRALNAHAREQGDDEAVLEATLALLERTQRPSERATLFLRASEAAARLGKAEDARTLLEQAANEDPGDVVTWSLLAEARERSGDQRAAAEACESLARASVVPAHQLLAWCDAARIWLDEVKDEERAMTALEQAAEIDVTHADVFQRLSALYSDKGLDTELARILDKRLDRCEDPDERVGLEVELARTLDDMGDLARARATLESALAKRPDHTTALGALAELCAKEGDWEAAEQAFVRLARIFATSEEQITVYERLADIYAAHLGNLSRAEVAYKEVLKRAPKNLAVLAKLVDVYKRQGDVARAVEAQQQIVHEATDPATRLERLVELAKIYESARDLRKAEQSLEAARKEFPTSVTALRALAEFYRRHAQMPAMQILLDRAAGDARRSFAAGRFVTALFEVLLAAYELRGKYDAARVVAATLAAVEGQPAELVGADARAADPRLDDVLAPEIVSFALRTLLTQAGDALDAAAPVDLRALRATPLVPGSPVGALVGSVATVVGLGALQILVSPALGRVAIPLSSNPPTLLVGEALASAPDERAKSFVVVRALKTILTRSSALVRGQSDDVAVLVSALFTALNPTFVPQGVDAKRVAETARKILPALGRSLDPTVGVVALEAAGILGTQASALAAGGQAWANRAALLAVGDPNAALEALAWAKGEDGAPRGSEERAAWIARHAEARDLLTFSVSDGYSEARKRLGLGA